MAGRGLARAAAGLCSVLPPDKLAAFLRRVCDLHVAHRRVPDREIEAAVEFAQGERPGEPGRQSVVWLGANAEIIDRVLEAVAPVFDGVTSTGREPGQVLPLLFRPGELLCVGVDTERAQVRPVEDLLNYSAGVQFICPNPMRGAMARNHAGRPSARCQNNVCLRRYLIAEFDDPGLTKPQQAQLATALGGLAPLVMAVDSGGKSVHAWFHVEAMGRQAQARFFAAACLLGADPTRWDVCGWVRMPGGLRLRAGGCLIRQRVLYFRPLEGTATHGA